VRLSGRCIIVWRPELRCFTFYSGYWKLYVPYFAPFINPVEHKAGTALSDVFSSPGSFLFPIPPDDWCRFSSRNVAGVLAWDERHCRKCVTTMAYRGVAKLGSFPKTICKYLGIFVIRLILNLSVSCPVVS